MKKVLLTLLFGGICVLNASDGRDTKPEAEGVTLVVRVRMSASPKWEHDLDAGLSGRTQGDVVTTFKIRRE